MKPCRWRFQPSSVCRADAQSQTCGWSLSESPAVHFIKLVTWHFPANIPERLGKIPNKVSWVQSWWSMAVCTVYRSSMMKTGMMKCFTYWFLTCVNRFRETFLESTKLSKVLLKSWCILSHCQTCRMNLKGETDSTVFCIWALKMQWWNAAAGLGIFRNDVDNKAGRHRFLHVSCVWREAEKAPELYNEGMCAGEFSQCLDLTSTKLGRSKHPCEAWNVCFAKQQK